MTDIRIWGHDSKGNKYPHQEWVNDETPIDVMFKEYAANNPKCCRICIDIALENRSGEHDD